MGWDGDLGKFLWISAKKNRKNWEFEEQRGSLRTFKQPDLHILLTTIPISPRGVEN